MTMDSQCRKFRDSLRNFDGAVFSRHSEHLAGCKECREYAWKKYPELQFSVLKNNSLTSGMLEDIYVTRKNVMSNWYGNIAKIAAVLIMLIGVSSYMFYNKVDMERSESLKESRFLAEDEIKEVAQNCCAPSIRRKSVSLSIGKECTGDVTSGKFVATASDYLEQKYPLVEKTGVESANYIIDEATDGSRIVFFQLQSCVDL